MAEQNYTAQDFERYHSGNMTSVEMHALERLALEDPFLADALEGYGYAQNPESDIREIKGRLEEKTKERKAGFFTTRRWVAIAASLLAILGIGYLMFPGPKNVQQLARQEVKPANSDSPKALAGNMLKSDSSMELTSASSDLSKSEGRKKPAKIMEPGRYNSKIHTVVADTVACNYSKSEDAALSKDKSVALQDDEYKKELSRSALPESMGYKTNVAQRSLAKTEKPLTYYQGKVVDIRGAPLANATVKDKFDNIATITDSAGRFRLALKDTGRTATVAAVGYTMKQADLKKNEDMTIVLAPVQNQLAEVVVTGFGKRKSSKEVASTTTIASGLQGKISGLAVTTSSLPSPEGGWEKFNSYLRKNINVPVDSSGVKFSGMVKVLFDVNKKGRPVNIKIDQSLCAECDKEAERLLLKGPRWKSPGKRGVAEVRF